MATSATLSTYMAAARAAIADADWDTALTQAICGQSVLAELPNSELEGRTRIEWRNTINDLIANIRRQQTASTGIKRARIEYTEPTDA